MWLLLISEKFYSPSVGLFMVEEKQISNYNHNQTCLFSEGVLNAKIEKKVKMYSEFVRQLKRRENVNTAEYATA